MNTPNTPATNSRKKAINSRVRSSMPHEIRTPANPASAVSRTIGALMPSTPRCQLTPMDSIHWT